MKSTTEKSLHTYDPRLFNREAADVAVPLILGDLQVGSVVDVGCGTGTWLTVFREHGIDEVLGIDGDHVDRETLCIDPADFRVHDLEQPLGLERRFDLALCLEVGEHLPESAADRLVSTLVELADAVVFSAAIPGQTGQHHLNLQWPEYWADRFARHGYACYDPWRLRLWGHERVLYWYQQNMLLYAREGVPVPFPAGPPRRLVHHQLYEKLLSRYERLKERRASPLRKIYNLLRKPFRAYRSST